VAFAGAPYIACIEGKEYEADFAIAEWPTDPAVSVVTLDYKEMRLVREECSPFAKKLPTPRWWNDPASAAIAASPDAAVQ
jgi:hypothetical protein